MKIMNTSRGFTLAEVLITLGIIGVVAAMTMPALVGKYQEKQAVAAVKVAYSTFSQANLRVIQEYGSMDSLVEDTLSPKENSRKAFREITKHIKKVKSCDKDKNCMGGPYKSLTGKVDPKSWDDYSNIETGVLANGITFYILNYIRVETGQFYGQIGIDINGNKKPNQMGVDFFHFDFGKDGIVLPTGVNLSVYKKHGMPIDNQNPDEYYYCDLTDTSNMYNGYGCTAWLLEHENMDYLRKNIGAKN